VNQLKTNAVAINRNLLLQAIAYLNQHPDQMSKMLADQFRYALNQHDANGGDRNG